MGTRYNAAHISEAAVKEAWSNYAKYDYFYTDELQKAQKTLESTTASARAQLAAKGIFEGDPKYTREIDRITNIAQADMASLQAGQRSLQTGAIKDLLTSGSITKYSAGNYSQYLATVDRSRELYTDPYSEDDPWRPVYTTVDSSSGRSSEEETQVLSGWRSGRSRMSVEGYNDALARDNALMASQQTMEGYYTGVWGGYDATLDIQKDQEQASSEAARGQAGSRAYTVQAQPKGQPGGGKPGNVFMQTPQEVAQDQAPQDEQGKAWWM